MSLPVCGRGEEPTLKWKCELVCRNLVSETEFLSFLLHLTVDIVWIHVVHQTALIVIATKALRLQKVFAEKKIGSGRTFNRTKFKQPF